MTRKEIFEEVYNSFVKEFVFCLPDDLIKSSENEILKQKIYELLQRVAKGYNRQDLDEFRNKEELLKEIVFQTIVVYTFFLISIPELANYLEIRNSKLIKDIEQKFLH